MTAPSAAASPPQTDAELIAIADTDPKPARRASALEALAARKVEPYLLASTAMAQADVTILIELSRSPSLAVRDRIDHLLGHWNAHPAHAFDLIRDILHRPSLEFEAGLMAFFAGRETYAKTFWEWNNDDPDEDNHHRERLSSECRALNEVFDRRRVIAAVVEPWAVTNAEKEKPDFNRLRAALAQYLTTARAAAWVAAAERLTQAGRRQLANQCLCEALTINPLHSPAWRQIVLSSEDHVPPRIADRIKEYPLSLKKSREFVEELRKSVGSPGD